MTNNQKMIHLAIDEAYKSRHKDFKHGAVLVKGKKIISTGYNQPSCNTHMYKSIHAEMQTIINAKKTRQSIDKYCVLYVVRVTNSGMLALSKPCDHCMSLIKKNNIRNIIFSNDSNYLQQMCL